MITRLLLIADIHANYPAFEAVLKKSPPENFDLILNAGDSTVYAPFPNETLSALSEIKNQISILGNTDLKVLKLLNGKEFKKPKKLETRELYLRTARDLTNENIRFLKSLKKEHLFQIYKINILLCHGSPARFNEYLFPNTPDFRFRELAKQYPGEIIIFGHSHIPFAKRIGNTLFINPGSIGRPFDGDYRASHAILEIRKDSVPVVHFYRCDYPLSSLLLKIRERKYPPIYEKMFIQGRKLN